MDISHLLNQTISRSTVASVGAYGEPTYNAATTLKARVEPVDGRQIRSADGEILAVDTLVWTKQSIALDDRLWLPGIATSDTTKVKKPVRIEQVPQLDGVTTFFKTYL